jgi:putative transposase
MEPKTYRYASTRVDDAEVREWLRVLASLRRRFGSRRLLLLLRREDIGLNNKKLFRLSHEERPSVRRSGGRKRTLGTRAPMSLPQAQNQRWSLDFVSDVLAGTPLPRPYGRRTLHPRVRGLVVDTSLSSQRVVRELDALISARDKPFMIVSDTGTS